MGRLDMGRKFVTLKVWHEGCWMLDLTERHRDVRIESRGVSHHAGHVHAEALVCACSREALHDALGAAVPDDIHREVLHEAEGRAEVFSSYPTARSFYQTTVASGLLVVGTIVHENGSERWQVLAESTQLDQALATLRQTAEVSVVRVADAASPGRAGPAGSPALSGAAARDGLLTRLASTLSDRQWEVIQRAVSEGYYDWPRGKNVKRLAEDLGVSSPTFLEHIRRAESRLVPTVVQELERLRLWWRP